MSITSMNRSAIRYPIFFSFPWIRTKNMKDELAKEGEPGLRNECHLHVIIDLFSFPRHWSVTRRLWEIVSSFFWPYHFTSLYYEGPSSLAVLHAIGTAQIYLYIKNLDLNRRIDRTRGYFSTLSLSHTLLVITGWWQCWTFCASKEMSFTEQQAGERMSHCNRVWFLGWRKRNNMHWVCWKDSQWPAPLSSALLFFSDSLWWNVVKCGEHVAAGGIFRAGFWPLRLVFVHPYPELVWMWECKVREQAVTCCGRISLRPVSRGQAFHHYVLAFAVQIGWSHFGIAQRSTGGGCRPM